MDPDGGSAKAGQPAQSRRLQRPTGLTQVHAPGQEGLQTSTLQEKLRPPPQGGPHAGKREFKDLQMTFFRFFSDGDRSPRRGLGRRGRKGQESASCLCSGSRAPSFQRPGSLQRLQAQPAWELLAKLQAEAQHQAASSKGAAPTPTPDPRPGGAWRGLESSLVQAGELGVASPGPQKACCVR